jgi:hypothetical protein
MECCWLEGDVLEFLIGHFDACRVTPGVQCRLNLQSFFCRRIGNQVDDDLMTGQRLTPPVHANMTTHAVFDLVPLAGPRRKMAYRNVSPCVIGQTLPCDLPQATPTAIAASPIGSNE